MIDRVDRPLLCLQEDAGNVFTYDPERYELNSAHEQDGGDKRRVSGDVKAEDQRRRDDPERIEQAHAGDQRADIGPYADRDGREAKYAVQREVP